MIMMLYSIAYENVISVNCTWAIESLALLTLVRALAPFLRNYVDHSHGPFNEMPHLKLLRDTLVPH